MLLCYICVLLCSHTSYSVKRLCYYVKKLWPIQHAIIFNVRCFVQTVSYYVKRLCYYVKCAGCFVHTVSYNVKRLCYYVKKSGYLVYEACELVCKCVIMLNVWFVMSTHCLIPLKGYAVMLSCL